MTSKILFRAWEIETHPSVRSKLAKSAAKRPIFLSNAAPFDIGNSLEIDLLLLYTASGREIFQSTVKIYYDFLFE